MNQIIIYEYEYFLNIKNEIDYSNIDKDLTTKITHIINNHKCFQFNNRSRNNKKYNNLSYNKKFIPKTEDKIILSYLNKLSSSNYDDLSQKIINNIRNENYNIIIDKLFNISYKQSNYTNIYIDLFKKIILSSKENNILLNNIKNLIFNLSNDIINNKNNDLDLIIKHTNKNDLNYDDFCDINKNSKYLKGKINIICNLIKNKIINIDKNYLITNLFKYENYENEIFLELVQIINNILLLNKTNINLLKNYITTNNFKGKMMIKFKLQDIIENKKIKCF
tara:strand:- start:685 stop:1521 length:837 start_codon:yes stop_codon:yes gene_type:complete